MCNPSLCREGSGVSKDVTLGSDSFPFQQVGELAETVTFVELLLLSRFVLLLLFQWPSEFPSSDYEENS